MSYHIYTTKGIVLANRAVREADRIYTILTQDLGLIRAIASGVRKEKSKLRGSIEPFSLCSISLVRGREYWRLTNVVSIENLVSQFKNRPEILLSFAKNFSLVEKLVPGEDKNPPLFNDIEDIINFVIKSNFETDEAESIEVLLAVRILFNLGYISKKDVPQEILEDLPSQELLSVITKNKKTIIRAINEGIEASHL